MKLIKLYEQWLEEEVAMPNQPATKPAESTPNGYSISVKPDGGTPFELIASGDQTEDTKEVRNFKVVDPKNSDSTVNSNVTISKKNDKDGNFDVVIVKDANNPETAKIYSGQVTISKS